MAKRRLRGGIFFSVLLLFSLFFIVLSHELETIQSMIHYTKEMRKEAQREMMMNVGRKRETIEKLRFDSGYLEIEEFENGRVRQYSIRLHDETTTAVYFERVRESKKE